MTIEEVRDALNFCEVEWHGLRTELQRQLPMASRPIKRVDNSFVQIWRYLDRAEKAEGRGRRYAALWWYMLARATLKEADGRMETLAERGLGAQVKERG